MKTIEETGADAICGLVLGGEHKCDAVERSIVEAVAAETGAVVIDGETLERAIASGSALPQRCFVAGRAPRPELDRVPLGVSFAGGVPEALGEARGAARGSGVCLIGGPALQRAALLAGLDDDLRIEAADGAGAALLFEPGRGPARRRRTVAGTPPAFALV